MTNRTAAMLKEKVRQRHVQSHSARPVLGELLFHIVARIKQKKALEQNEAILLEIQKEAQVMGYTESKLKRMVRTAVQDSLAYPEMTKSAGKASLSVADSARMQEATSPIINLKYEDSTLPDWVEWELFLSGGNCVLELIFYPSQAANTTKMCDTKHPTYLKECTTVTFSQIFGTLITERLKNARSLDLFLYFYYITFDSAKSRSVFCTELIKAFNTAKHCKPSKWNSAPVSTFLPGNIHTSTMYNGVQFIRRRRLKLSPLAPVNYCFKSMERTNRLLSLCELAKLETKSELVGVEKETERLANVFYQRIVDYLEMRLRLGKSIVALQRVYRKHKRRMFQVKSAIEAETISKHIDSKKKKEKSLNNDETDHSEKRNLMEIDSNNSFDASESKTMGNLHQKSHESFKRGNFGQSNYENKRIEVQVQVPAPEVRNSGLYLAGKELLELIKVLREQVRKKSSEKDMLMREIKNVVGSALPCAKVQVFGSWANELALPDSDVDCFYLHRGGDKGLLSCQERLAGALNESIYQRGWNPGVTVNSTHQFSADKFNVSFEEKEVMCKSLDRNSVRIILEQSFRKASSPSTFGRMGLGERRSRSFDLGASSNARLDTEVGVSQDHGHAAFISPQRYRQKAKTREFLSSEVLNLASVAEDRHYEGVGYQCTLTQDTMTQLQRIQGALLRQSYVKSISLINSRIPLLKTRVCCSGDIRREHHCARCFQIDVSNGHSPGHTRLSAVEFIRQAQEVEPLFSPLFLFLKFILFIEKLNDPYKGGLASFPLACMLLASLRHHKQQNREGQSNRSSSYGDSVESKLSASHTRHMKGSPTEWAMNNSSGVDSDVSNQDENSETESFESRLGRALLQFLKLYGVDFNSIAHGVSVLGVNMGYGRAFVYSLEAGVANGRAYAPLVVDNPFWAARNIAQGCYNFPRVQQVLNEYFFKLKESLSLFTSESNSVLYSVVPFKWGAQGKEILREKFVASMRRY